MDKLIEVIYMTDISQVQTMRDVKDQFINKLNPNINEY